MTRQKPTPTFSLAMRWLKERDLPSVLRIDQATPCPMGEYEMRAVLRMQNVASNVVEVGPVSSIGGFVIFAINGAELILTHLAVHPDVRRRGIGRFIIDQMKSNAERHECRAVTSMVRESNLPVCNFLKAHGFMAIELQSEFFADPDEDGYLFRFCRERSK